MWYAEMPDMKKTQTINRKLQGASISHSQSWMAVWKARCVIANEKDFKEFKWGRKKILRERFDIFVEVWGWRKIF